jgi:hypothetical protein
MSLKLNLLSKMISYFISVIFPFTDFLNNLAICFFNHCLMLKFNDIGFLMFYYKKKYLHLFEIMASYKQIL